MAALRFNTSMLDAVRHQHAMLPPADHIPLPGGKRQPSAPRARRRACAPHLIDNASTRADPALEPTIHIHGSDHPEVPYEIMAWFMQNVADEVTRARAGFLAARPTESAG